jgi:hypothetical protein
MEICITPIGDAESIGLKNVKSKEEKKPRKPKPTKSAKVDLHILFAGTCLAKESTLIENYDFIQFKMNDVFENWNQLLKQTNFVLKNVNDKEQKDRYGAEQLEKDKYIFCENPVHDELMIDFLSSNKIKYDVILLLEAHNLMDIFLEGNEEERTLFDSDIKDLYDKIKIFYESFKSGGILVNVHYKTTDKTLFFCSMEDFYTTSSVWSLDVHVFLLKIINQLFVKLEPGIYQKVDDKDIDTVIQECYQSAVEELVKIGSDYLKEEGQNEELVKRIDETFFKSSLEKNKSYYWEKPIVFCMSQLIKNVLNTEDSED